eukprot:CAMPEP_0194108300 /NCGR_PEP_ID=MMETSP0150-20130528/8033_1 /TAXON_ID=122233 /ORGANISM="Chaetoceros debilis, Strain MM31A-1" /LENGTH=66 /DNA_ID=CAMNT_0038796975 /DNA_START=64 /DNA_END=261 /DNA_ORIENTATION=+
MSKSSISIAFLIWTRCISSKQCSTSQIMRAASAIARSYSLNCWVGDDGNGDGNGDGEGDNDGDNDD